MTDKQIIDDCDVQNCDFFKYCDTDVEFSECLAHWHPNEDYSNVYYAKCDVYPNCYYKQLKAKEQECEMLDNENKRLVGELANNVFDGFEELDQLKAELEKEKALKDTYFACYHTKHGDLAKKYEQLKAENKILKEKITISSNSDKRTLKIIKTLTEIKEIANFDCQCGHNQMCICNVCDKFDLILQKISECEVEDVANN